MPSVSGDMLAEEGGKYAEQEHCKARHCVHRRLC
jgi:hypothetical protein